MSDHIISSWKGGLTFENEIGEHKVIVDAPSENDVSNGPSPKKLLLVGLAGCSGMDVVSILKKMQVPFTGLTISVDAEQTEEHPKYYKTIKIIYKVTGENVEKDKVEKMVEASKQTFDNNTEGDKALSGPLADEPIAAEIGFDDFAKVDLRVAKIIKAEHVEGADKLLRLTLDLGGETRNVFAGIKSAYEPADIEGKLTIMVANLAARKMKFGMSEGMVLAVEPMVNAAKAVL